MGWLIALGILVLLAVMPLGASLRYSSQGVQVKLILGLLQILVYPGKKKPQKEKKPKKQPKEKPKQAAPKKPAQKKPKKKGGPISDFIPLVYVALDFLADLPRIFRINRLDVNLVQCSRYYLWWVLKCTTAKRT